MHVGRFRAQRILWWGDFALAEKSVPARAIKSGLNVTPRVHPAGQPDGRAPSREPAPQPAPNLELDRREAEAVRWHPLLPTSCRASGPLPDRQIGRLREWLRVS